MEAAGARRACADEPACGTAARAGPRLARAAAVGARCFQRSGVPRWAPGSIASPALNAAAHAAALADVAENEAHTKANGMWILNRGCRSVISKNGPPENHGEAGGSWVTLSI